jgi:hypothetical protein
MPTSFAPDWTTSIEEELFTPWQNSTFYSTSRYSANRNASALVLFSTDTLDMSVRGVLWDDISTTMPPFPISGLGTILEDPEIHMTEALRFH